MNKKNVDAIVTGGSGFIGSHLVDALVEQGKHVLVIDVNRAPKLYRNPEATYKVLDIRDESTMAFIEKKSPSVVYHLAAHIHDRESVDRPVMNAQHNILGSLHVFEGAKRAGAKIVFASTGGVIYGNQETLPATEDVLEAPVTPYAVSKLCAERYLNFYDHVHRMSYTILRLANVYGPRQDASAESGAIGIFTNKLLHGSVPSINNDGKTTRDYVYVGDVVRAFLLAGDTKKSGLFNIGTARQISTQEVFDTVCAAVGSQVAPDHREDVIDMVKHSALDVSRAKKDLAWEPKMPFEQGVEQTVEWYKKHL